MDEKSFLQIDSGDHVVRNTQDLAVVYFSVSATICVQFDSADSVGGLEIEGVPNDYEVVGITAATPAVEILDDQSTC